MLSSYLIAAVFAAFVTASPVEQQRRDNANWNFGFQTTDDNKTPPGSISGHGPQACRNIPTSKAQGVTGSSDGFSNLKLCVYTAAGCNSADLCGSLGDIEGGGDGETACYTNNLHYIRSYKIGTSC